MANTDNLVPIRSEEEARKKGRAGGKASGEARRRKKTMKEALTLLMETQAPESVKAQLEAAGVDASDADYQTAMLAAQMVQAVKGNTRAAVWLSEIMGERVQNVKVEQKIDDSRKALEAWLDAQGESAEADI